MVQKVTKNTDADTLQIDGEATRLLGVNTAESVAVNADRNSDEGRKSSARVKKIVPQGTEVRTEEHGKGKFGRRLADVKLLSNGGEVDMGLLLLDQSMSQYSVDYGKHPNPEQHDIYKEYYSENAPYQYADTKNTLSPEELGKTVNAIKEFEEAEKAFNEGNMSREDYETKMVAAYGDGAKVAQMRYQLKDWNRKFEMEKYDKSDRMAYDWAHQNDKNRAVYDKAVRLGEASFYVNPEQSTGFWAALLEDTKTSFSALNDFAVMSRHSQLENVRRYSDGLEIAETELLKGVSNPAFNKVILEEAVNNGDEAALMLRDNIITSETNNAAMAEMPLAVQLATAIPALLTSPMTMIPGVKIAQGTMKVSRTIDTVMAAGRVKSVAIPTKVALYASAGSLEAGVAAIPRLSTDETYSSMDMLNEMKYGAVFGVAIPAVFKGSKATKAFYDQWDAQRAEVLKKIQAETEAFVATPKVVKVEPKVMKSRQLDDDEEFGLLQVSKQLTEALGKHEGEVATKALTPEDLAELDVRTPNTYTPEDRQLAMEAKKAADGELRNISSAKTAELVNSHTHQPYKASKSVKAVDVATLGASKSFTQTMLESTSKIANLIGTKILELPEGFGGSKVRAPTATLMQHSLKTRYMSEVFPQYHKNIGEYAAEHGKGTFNAQHMDSASNPIVKQFGRDIISVLEAKRQGRASDVTSPTVLKMVDAFEASMAKQFDDMVEAGVGGFKAERRIKNYFPQLWERGQIRGAITNHGRDTVEETLSKGYLASKHNGINTAVEARQVAKQFVDDMLDETNMTDHAMPKNLDSRAHARLDIDTGVSHNGLSVLDLMETDFTTVTARYTNRAAGNIAVARATGGGITSDVDWSTLRQHMEDEGASANDLQLFDDAQNIAYGRPTRGGLEEGIREVRDAVALSKMGGLGMAQAAEFGNVLARTMGQLFSDPKTFKKIWAMAGESKDNVALMRETQALSGISNEVHLLERQATHLDQAKLAEIKSVRNIANKIAGKLAFGKWKAPASYILTQGSGYNMIRRFERRVANASFMLDTAKHFKDGSGTMSPERMKDIGLNPDSMKLQKIFRDVVEYDDNGIVKKLNLDQWDAATREEYHLAMYRDDATMVQQSIGGELPAWVNKPMMTVIAQFKQQAILANKKNLSRNAQFADRETVLGVTMNMAMAFTTRAAKFATLGAAAYAVTGDKSKLETAPEELEYFAWQKYVASFGFFPDMVDIMLDTTSLGTQEAEISKEDLFNLVASEVPMLDWMKDYTQVVNPNSTTQERAEATKGVALLGNMAVTDTIVKAVQQQLED